MAYCRTNFHYGTALVLLIGPIVSCTETPVQVSKRDAVDDSTAASETDSGTTDKEETTQNFSVSIPQGSISPTSHPDISWDSIENASHYQVKISNGTGCSGNVVDEQTTSTSYTFTQYRHAQTYYVCVFAQVGSQTIVATQNDSSFTTTIETIILGQPDATSSTANNGGISASTLNRPSNVMFDGQNLVVSDYYNHRVLIWNGLPASNGAAADVVVGQPDASSNTANNGGRSASTLYWPYTAYLYNSQLFVADAWNDRVLVWNTVPTTDGTAAGFVIGQPDFTNITSGTSASSFNGAFDVLVADSKLVIMEHDNNRGLIFNAIPTATGASADIAVGQPNLTSGTANNGGRSAATAYYPDRSTYYEGKFLVADRENYRVLIFDSLPTANGASADTVVGQSDMTSAANSGPTQTDLGKPSGVVVCDGKMYVTDRYNSRIMVWDSIPTSDYAAADAVIGQDDYVSGSANKGGSVSVNTLNEPYSIGCDYQRLYIADSKNNRVIIMPRP